MSAFTLPLVEEIKTLYIKDDRVMSLGFSGGKDSSLCVVLLLEALLAIPREQLTKKVYILYSDTLMELLPVQMHTYKVLDKIRDFANEHNLPIEVLHAKPPTTETMWSMMIGKGIRPPSRDLRC